MIVLVKITINGRKCEISDSEKILSACLKIGVHVPRLCFLKGHTPQGRCCMCVVEINESELSLACLTLVRDGMKISTNSEKIWEIRKKNLIKIMKNHSLDCLRCRKGGNCKLQKHGAMFDWSDQDIIIHNAENNIYTEIYKNILYNQSKCIHCNRCVLFLSETCGMNIKNISFLKKTTPSNIDIIGSIIDICPTAALMNDSTQKRFSAFTRKEINTIDASDPFMPQMSVLQHKEEILSIISKKANCLKDEIRFIYNKLTKRKQINCVVHDDILKNLSDAIIDTRREKKVFVIGDNIDIESLFYIQHIAKKRQDCCIVFGNTEKQIIDLMGISEKSMIKSDAFVIFGNPRFSELLNVSKLAPLLKEKLFVNLEDNAEEIKSKLTKFQYPVILVFDHNIDTFNHIKNNFEYPMQIIPDVPSQMLGKYIQNFWTIDSFQREFNRHDIKFVYTAGFVKRENFWHEDIQNIYHSYWKNSDHDCIFLYDKHFLESSLSYINVFRKIVRSTKINSSFGAMSVNEFTKTLFEFVFFDNYEEELKEVTEKIENLLHQLDNSR